VNMIVRNGLRGVAALVVIWILEKKLICPLDPRALC